MSRKTEMPEDYKSRHLARTKYEQAIVKNLKPMLGPYGDNETASLFLNGAVEKRAKLFGDDVSRNAPTAGELLARAMNYAPSAPEPKPAKKEPGVIDRVKEAAGVARDLVETVVGGYADASTLSKKDVSDFGVAMTAADLARNMERNGIDSNGVEVRANGQITNVKSGRTRDISESDRRGISEFKKEINLQQAAKGGNASGGSKASSVPSGHNAALDGYSGPRIVINPSTFRNEKDALCVAFDEAFRIVMEDNGFDPVAEPTEKQREFFSDTAYADDERMLKRTILARICTFDTSVTDPTDEQLQEAVEFLDTVMEIGAPQSTWEQRAVQRIRDTVAKALESGKRKPAEQEQVPPQEDGENAKNGIDSDGGNMVSYEPERGTGVNDVHQMS